MRPRRQPGAARLRDRHARLAPQDQDHPRTRQTRSARSAPGRAQPRDSDAVLPQRDEPAPRGRLPATPIRRTREAGRKDRPRPPTSVAQSGTDLPRSPTRVARGRWPGRNGWARGGRGRQRCQQAQSDPPRRRLRPARPACVHHALHQTRHPDRRRYRRWHQAKCLLHPDEDAAHRREQRPDGRATQGALHPARRDRPHPHRRTRPRPTPPDPRAAIPAARCRPEPSRTAFRDRASSRQRGNRAIPLDVTGRSTSERVCGVYGGASLVHIPSMGSERFQDLGGDRVHLLVGLDVVLLGDLRRGVPEHLGGEIGATGPVEDRGDRAAEGVRRDPFDARLRHDAAKAPPDVVGRQRRAVASEEEQVLGVLGCGHDEPLPQHLGSEARDRHGPGRLRCLGVGLPMRWLTRRRHDRPADANRRRRDGDVDVALADGEHLADAGGCPEHDLDDLLQLAVRRRPGHARTTPPAPDGGPDGIDLLDRQRHGLRRRLPEPGRVAHRVLGHRVVPHRQSEREAEHGPRLLGHAVALRGRQGLDELVDLAHGDLAQHVVLEGRHHELAHVPLVERPRARRELVLQVEVLQPDLDELAERAVAGEFARGDVARPLREHLLQVALGLLVGGAGGRDAAELAVVVAVAGARADPSRPAP